MDETQDTHVQPTEAQVQAAPPLARDRLLRYAGAGAAAVVIAVGAFALGRSGADDSTATPALASAGVPGAAATGSTPAAPQSGSTPAVPQGGSMPTAPPGGMPPGGGVPGVGTDVTGATEQKVAKAALAKVDGTIERVEALPDGSYLAHVITNSGEVYVTVDSNFEVTGTSQAQGVAPAAPGSTQ